MKNRFLFAIVAVALICALPAMAAPKPQAPQITGQYLESRTADIYTGPCIANSETNLAGKQAVMAWHIDQGTWTNVDLSGLTVVAVVNATDTLGMDGQRAIAGAFDSDRGSIGHSGAANGAGEFCGSAGRSGVVSCDGGGSCADEV